MSEPNTLKGIAQEILNNITASNNTEILVSILEARKTIYNGIYNIYIGGNGYNKSGSIISLGINSDDFYNNNSLVFLLNGVEQLKGFEINYIDEYNFRLNKIIDAEDIIIVKKLKNSATN